MKLLGFRGFSVKVNSQESFKAMPDFYKRLSRADLSYLPLHTDLLPLSSWGILFCLCWFSLVLKCANRSFKLKCSVKAGSSSGCLC